VSGHVPALAHPEALAALLQRYVVELASSASPEAPAFQ
jgi:hypothetical protein